MSNNSIMPAPPTLARYNVKLDLVEVRRHPETYPRIGTTDYPAAVSQMTEIVFAAAFYRGQEMDDTQIKFIAAALVSEILADTKLGLRTLSWLEIGRTIRAAVLGAGRDMFGVSVASLYAALVDYAKGEGHEADRRA